MSKSTPINQIADVNDNERDNQLVQEIINEMQAQESQSEIQNGQTEQTVQIEQLAHEDSYVQNFTKNLFDSKDVKVAVVVSVITLLLSLPVTNDVLVKFMPQILSGGIGGTLTKGLIAGVLYLIIKKFV